ncbi:hypothetical protein GMMP13_1810018 [Candidatus Magnetomoraceae bacterium gMMP-13]
MLPDSEEVIIRVSFQGRTAENHHTVLYLNGSKISDAKWNGSAVYIQEIEVDQNLIISGSNTLKIELPGDTNTGIDNIYLNWIEVICNQFIDSNDKKFSVEANDTIEFEIRNAPQEPLKIYDITEINDVKIIVNHLVESDSSIYTALFEDEINENKTYYLAAENDIKKPDLLLWDISDLKNAENGVDYIIIAPDEFLSATQDFCKFRENQGMRVKTVSTEAIYNEFNSGMFDPDAIKSFLTYAYKNWQAPAPTYVFLMGDANMDYKDRFGTGKENKVPAHLSFTFELGLTPDDNWYVCVDGDDILPDMLVGRIPANNPEMLKTTLDKIMGYENSETIPQNILFAADNNETAYEELNEILANSLPSEFKKDKVYLSKYDDSDDATEDIITSMDKGALLTNYVGHGSVTNWAGELMFENSDVESLNNGKNLTFVVSMSCLNGYFALLNQYSLSEAFVLEKNKGAIAVFAPAALTYLWELEFLNKALFLAIFEDRNDILGESVLQSKISAYGNGISDECMKMFNLIGDPAIKLKINHPPTIQGIPLESVIVNTLYSFTPIAEDLDPGDKLIFSIENKPEWAAFDTATGTLSGTPSDEYIGSITENILIRVTDRHGESAFLKAFAISVERSNVERMENNNESNESSCFIHSLMTHHSVYPNHKKIILPNSSGRLIILNKKSGGMKNIITNRGFSKV